MSRSRCFFYGLIFVCNLPVALAQDAPSLTLDYRELTQREPLKFRMNGADHTASVGLLNWDFPATTFATVGFDPKLTSFCLEPLVPVVAGNQYQFQMDKFGSPKDFNLKDDEDGRKEAGRRTKFVRELYGRNYAEVLADPKVAAPAFQLALWEILSETKVPEGPIPYSLNSGTFQTNFPKGDAAPAYVTQAQKYLLGLTGDDAAFGDSPALAGQELVRLTGLRNAAGVIAQSQVALRNKGGVSNSASGYGGDAGALGPVGTSAGGGSGRPSTSFGGIGGGGLGGGGIGGGFGGGFPLVGGIGNQRGDFRSESW